MGPMCCLCFLSHRPYPCSCLCVCVCVYSVTPRISVKPNLTQLLINTSGPRSHPTWIPIPRVPWAKVPVCASECVSGCVCVCVCVFLRTRLCVWLGFWEVVLLETCRATRWNMQSAGQSTSDVANCLAWLYGIRIQTTTRTRAHISRHRYMHTH